MQFSILAERSDGDRQVFRYDNATNVLSAPDGTAISYPAEEIARQRANDAPARVFDAAAPLSKSRAVRVLKIQMGLSCNYSCTYCSQRFVPNAPETAPKDVERFLKMLDHLDLSEAEGLKIEFWGGEPLVYWKTLKPLAEALRDRFDGWSRPPTFSMITNGSLLTREINDWLVMMGFHVGISHDGPGQHVRGPDPLDDPGQRAAILNLHKRLKPVGRVSFNAMLHAGNHSRKDITDFFAALLGDPSPVLGEGSLIDAYDEGGLEMSLKTPADHVAFRKRAFNDIYATEGRIGFKGVLSKIDHFTESVLSQRPAETLAQKCGMDDASVLAVDLRGNVITCQNVSSVATAPNGQRHLAGHISNLDAVAIKTSTHWSKRPHCRDCPVLHLCQGSCMYLEGERWDVSCDGAYSDNVVLFALSFEKMTGGYVPVTIDSDGDLPATRRDIWGTLSAQSVADVPTHSLAIAVI